MLFEIKFDLLTIWYIVLVFSKPKRERIYSTFLIWRLAPPKQNGFNLSPRWFHSVYLVLFVVEEVIESAAVEDGINYIEGVAKFFSPTFNSFKAPKASFIVKENSVRHILNDGNAHPSSFNAHLNSSPWLMKKIRWSKCLPPDLNSFHILSLANNCAHKNEEETSALANHCAENRMVSTRTHNDFTWFYLNIFFLYQWSFCLDHCGFLERLFGPFCSRWWLFWWFCHLFGLNGSF